MSNELKKCGNCLLPETYETLVIADDRKSCNMCQTSTFKQTEIDWDRRKKMLDKVIKNTEENMIMIALFLLVEEKIVPIL